MKRLFLVAALAAAPIAAHAQSAPPLPTTIELPTAMVGQLLQYLGTRPYDESHAIIDAISGCAQIQIPSAQGVIRDNGQCPQVSASRHAGMLPAAPLKPRTSTDRAPKSR